MRPRDLGHEAIDSRQRHNSRTPAVTLHLDPPGAYRPGRILFLGVARRIRRVLPFSTRTNKVEGMPSKKKAPASTVSSVRRNVREICKIEEEALQARSVAEHFGDI